MGFYLTVSMGKVLHLYFERDREAIEKAWRYVYSKTGKQGSIHDTAGNLLHDGPAREREEAK